MTGLIAPVTSARTTRKLIVTLPYLTSFLSPVSFTVIYIGYCPAHLDNNMKHSRFGDLGYWYEGRNIKHSQIHAKCVAKGGSKFMFKSPGVLSHVYNWYQDLS